MRTRRKWSELSSFQQTALLTAVCVELSLTATAWVDLLRRPSTQVHGPKSCWAVAILIQPVGPIVYLTAGVQRDPDAN